MGVYTSYETSNRVERVAVAPAAALPNVREAAATDAANMDTTPDAKADAAERDADVAAEAHVAALFSPIRFHLRNDGSADVYLGLRLVDRCAFDYTIAKLDPSDGGQDAGAEQPMNDGAPTRRANVTFELSGSSVEGTDLELSIRLP